MSRKIFTEEQQQLLRQNPYVYSVSETYLSLTKEFKERFIAAYNAGDAPRKILEDHGFDIELIGKKRVGNISQNIRREYKVHGHFEEGHTRRDKSSADVDAEIDELERLRHEVSYLRQEVDFLKKLPRSETKRSRCCAHE